MEDREGWLARTFVELADTLVAGFDVVEFLSMLASKGAEIVDAPEAGIVLVNGGPTAHLTVMASSTERMRTMELFEVQNAEGPCFDCVRTGEPVRNQRLDATADARWPVFSPMARAAGYHVVHAFPLRLRSDVIGALNVFHDRPDAEISDADATVAQAFADAATIGILQERALRAAAELAGHLQGALDSRVAIEQAKGVVAERLTIGVDEAFDRLRDYARTRNRFLSEVATDVVNGALSADELNSPG